MKHRIATSFLALCMAAPVLAGPTDHIVDLDILPGWRTETGTHMAGLQITLAPGWKTYWRTPGDGGIPPRFGWQGSQNLGGAAFHWPVPDVFEDNGMRSIGYYGSVIIPVELTMPDATAPARMRGQLQIGVCEDICVPVMLEFDAMLPVGNTRDPAIVAALLDRPATANEAGVGDVVCTIEPIEDGLRLTTRIDMPPMRGGREDVVIEAGDQQVWVSPPQTWRDGGDLFARSDMIHVNGGSFALNRSEVRITVLAGGRAVDLRGCASG